MLKYDFKSIIPGHETKNQWMLHIMNGEWAICQQKDDDYYFKIEHRRRQMVFDFNTMGIAYYIQFEFAFELFHFIIIFIVDLLI